MMSSNVALLHSNNCCVLEPAICEDLDLHVVIIYFHCRGLYGEQVEHTEKLQAHALKFMHVFAILTESLEDNTGDTKDINDFLLMLGAKHASFKGFEQVFFL